MDDYMMEDDKAQIGPLAFYSSGWFSKVRPHYRKWRVNYGEVDECINIDWEAERKKPHTDYMLFLSVVNSLSVASIFIDTDPELVERILAKAVEAADFDPKAFYKVMETVFPWLMGISEIPTFEMEKEYRTLYSKNTPVDYYVAVHTVRLFHEREPFKRLNLNMRHVSRAEKSLAIFGDLTEYYRFIEKTDIDLPPKYMVEYWAAEGVQIE